jgi:hypothetical protein
VLSGPVDQRLVDELVGRAQAEGVQLTGEGGLLQLGIVGAVGNLLGKMWNSPGAIIVRIGIIVEIGRGIGWLGKEKDQRELQAAKHAKWRAQQDPEMAQASERYEVAIRRAWYVIES